MSENLEFNFDEFLNQEIQSVSKNVATYEEKLARARGEKPASTSQAPVLEPKTVYLNTNSLGKYKFSLLPTEARGYRCITNLRKINIPYDVVKNLGVQGLRSTVKSADVSNFPLFSNESREVINRFNILFDQISWKVQEYIDKGLLPKEFNSVNQYGKNTALSKIPYWIIFSAKVYDFPKGVKVLSDDKELEVGGTYTFATKSASFMQAYKSWIENLKDLGYDPRSLLGRDVTDRPNYIIFDFGKGQPAYTFSLNAAPSASLKKNKDIADKFVITDHDLEITKTLDHHIIDVTPDAEERLVSSLNAWIEFFAQRNEAFVKLS